MKKIILLLAVAAMITQAEAQTPNMKATNVPAAVTTAFNQDHPSVKDVKWTLRDRNNYEGAYKEGKVNTYVTYDASGNLVETRIEIADSALPAPVLSYVKQNYKDDKVELALKVTAASGPVTYLARVKDMHLLFDSNGTLIRATKNKKNKYS